MLVYTQKGDKVFNLGKVISADIDYNVYGGSYEVTVTFTRSLKDRNLTVYIGTKEQCEHVLKWLVGKSRNPNYGIGDELKSDYLTFYK